MFSDGWKKKREAWDMWKICERTHTHTRATTTGRKFMNRFSSSDGVDIAYAIVSMSCEKFALNIDLHHLCRFARLATVLFARGKDAEKQWQDEDGENRIFHRVNDESSTHAGGSNESAKSRVNGFPLFAFYVLFTYDESQILSARAKWFIAVDFIVVGENSLWWWIYGILHRNVLAHSRVAGRDVWAGAVGGRRLAYERWKAFQST